jgi:hypothetical protein
MSPQKQRDDERDDDVKPEEPEAENEANEAKSILVEDQASFIDEHPRTGKQFGDGRKVADLDRVGAMAPDADAEGLPKRKKQ